MKSSKYRFEELMTGSQVIGQLLKTSAGRRKLAVGLESTIKQRMDRGTLTEQQMIIAISRLKQHGYKMRWVENG
jgi:hypothetical protein